MKRTFHVPIATLGPGQTFGEIEVLKGLKRITYA